MFDCHLWQMYIMLAIRLQGSTMHEQYAMNGTVCWAGRRRFGPVLLCDLNQEELQIESGQRVTWWSACHPWQVCADCIMGMVLWRWCCLTTARIMSAKFVKFKSQIPVPTGSCSVRLLACTILGGLTEQCPEGTLVTSSYRRRWSLESSFST